MKSQTRWALTALLLLLGSIAAVAQTTTVHGIAKDRDGKPIVGAIVELKNQENGRTYQLKTGKDGSFSSIAIERGVYNVKLIQNGQTIWETNFQATLSPLPSQTEQTMNTINLDLSKLQNQAAGQMSEEEKAQYEKQKAEVAKQQQEATKIKGLNQMLNDAKAAADQKNFAQAVNIMRTASKTDTTHDLIWGKLGDYLMYDGDATVAAGQKDEGMALYQEGADAIGKAVDITKTSGDPKIKAREGSWETTQGNLYTRMHKYDEAATAFTAAAQADPQLTAMDYSNAGRVLFQSGKSAEAAAAFDKALAADPNYADAYFEKGRALFGQGQADSSGKYVPPAGTAEALNKYLELKGDGPHAQEAKDMLAAMGATLTTSYGKGRTASKPTKKK